MTAKYQPYKGTGAGKPWYWYSSSWNGVPKRLRTKGDWIWNAKPAWETRAWHDWLHTRNEGWLSFCDQCGFEHCHYCPCFRPWKKLVSTGGSTFGKRKAHRDFRRLAKYAIYLDLIGEEVSHNFCVYGDWLD